MQPRDKMRLALQKSGRLAEGSQLLLTKCGIKAQANKNQLFVQDDDFGIDFIFVRDDDIPGLVEAGICDLGIVGQNLLDEYCGTGTDICKNLLVVKALGFSRCRLSIAAPKRQIYEEVSSLKGKIIATSYPNILDRFLQQKQINAQIVTMHGSVELAPQIGIADLICDLVSSGATLRENGLREVIKITETEAVLIANNTTIKSQKTRLDRLLLRINSVLGANQNKYIMMHIERSKLAMLTKILPGCESPTVLELQGVTEKVAVHVVSSEIKFWETIEKLKQIGATSILVVPIEKIIM
jgi:ATP phosphoribosyltransferase